MRQDESFTWIGPFTSDDCAGCVARGFAAGLARAGATVGHLDTGTGDLEPALDLDGTVRAGGTTVVRQGPLSALARTASIVARGAGAREVAYAVADTTTPDTEARALLEACHEVWTPSFGQGEILAALGVPREKLRVIVPGTDTVLAPRPDLHGGRARVLFVGSEAPERDDVVCVASEAPVGSRAFRAELERADAVVLAVDPDPFAATVLDVLASGRRLASVESGAVLEHADAEQCVGFDPSDPHALERALDEIARRCLLRAGSPRTNGASPADAAAAAVLARADRPRTLAPERLERVLADLGLPTARQRLAGSRAKVRIVPVGEVQGAWERVFAKELRRVDPETTIVLWVDETIARDTEAVAARAEGTIARAGSDPDGVDVLVVTAPLAHAPREWEAI